ncbi:MAG TPA: hypothetical protein VGO50_12550 [Pyrinomonadaceae bacterium]|jgi:hypothetical protein|nr:hypothetical protein [Pyrinomonadaceae bacterium]
MKHGRNVFSLLGLIAAIVLMSAVHTVVAQQDRQFIPKEAVDKAKAEAKSGKKSDTSKAAAPAPEVLECTGPVSRVLDVAFEGLKFTPADYFTLPGGGEGGGFDKTPVLSTKVRLVEGVCLNAHFSAIVGGEQTYGVAPLALFQVSLTPAVAGGMPRHMVGHYENPYGGLNGPAIAEEAERDVDMIAGNFFQRVGTGPHELPPGDYYVDVWWSGNGPGGALAMDFVLKLYFR